MLDTRDGGLTHQAQNLSWTIVFFMKQVPHQSSELDMQTSHHPHMHGLWTHEGGGNPSESPRGVFDENSFCGYLMFLYVRVMIYVISNQVSGHVYARFPFVCSIREGVCLIWDW